MTGSDGYIGSHLKLYLRERGIHVQEYIFDIRMFSHYALIDIDMVIHLAALTGVRKSFDKPEEYYDINVEGSRAIFKQCKKEDIPIIYASSSNAKEWWTNPYAMTKKIMEEIAPENSIGIRPHTVYPGRPDMLYDQLKKDSSWAGPIKYINGNHYRDFTHIEDFCSAAFTIIENYDIIDIKVIDIGCGKSQSVLEVARTSGWDGEVRMDPTPKERESTEADISTLTELGWNPIHENCYIK
jgi:nucleoside-diphosphate-sugar epimerase